MLAFVTNPVHRQRLLVALICAACALVATAGVVGYELVKPRRVGNLNREARAALARGDLAEASLKTRRALQILPNDAPACAIMAEMCERIHSADAVTWRERLAEIDGGSTPSLVALASAARSFGKHPVAQTALARVPEPERHRADYLAVAGAVALDLQKIEEAERCFREANQLEPENPLHLFSLGMAQAQSGDFFKREEGRKRLIAMAAQPQFAVAALRSLAVSYEATRDFQAALRVVPRLLALPEHSFLDELIRLRLLHATGDADLAQTLAELQRKSAKSGRDAGALILWMSGAGLAAEAVQWAEKRTPQVSGHAETKQPLAACHLHLQDWTALLALTKDGPWLSTDYLRHAYRARALRELGRTSLAHTEWEQALALAAGRPDAIVWLADIAAHSRWSEEAEQALWAAIQKNKAAAWAVERLGRRYHEEKNTDGLRRIAARLIAADPGDENVQNDFAFLSLLLDKDGARAASIARDLHTRHPGNAAFASTHALALHGAKRFSEALQVLESLPAAQLDQPAIALYYGIVLTANREPERARKYLEIGRRAPLLPEEAQLLAKATEAISVAQEGKP